MNDMTNPGALAAAGVEQIANKSRSHRENSTARPKRKTAVAVVLCGEAPVRIPLCGRTFWALRELLAAGSRGVTPIDDPGPRWSDYVFKLRNLGIAVETVTERHGGPFPGTHPRYGLISRGIIEDNTTNEHDASTNWRSSGSIIADMPEVARLKRRVEQALAVQDEDAAAEAHGALVAAEHQLRLAETARKCAR